MGCVKVKNPWAFYLGIIILIILGVSYFITIDVADGANYVTRSSLLGKIIFYNPFILALYIVIGIALIVSGLKRR